MAAQLMARKVFLLRGLCSWIILAAVVLPVPDSPVMSTTWGERAARRISPASSFIDGLVPIMRPLVSGGALTSVRWLAGSAVQVSESLAALLAAACSSAIVPASMVETQ